MTSRDLSTRTPGLSCVASCNNVINVSVFRVKTFRENLYTFMYQQHLGTDLDLEVLRTEVCRPVMWDVNMGLEL
jgi:hypothetical protein